MNLTATLYTLPDRIDSSYSSPDSRNERNDRDQLQLNGTVTLSGGSYQLNDGFWGGASINYNIYLPLVLKNF